MRSIGNPTKRSGARRSWFITTAIGVALLIIAVSVFTVSAGSRNITNAAQRLHVAHETVLVNVAAHAQIGFAVHFATIQSDLRLDTAAALTQSTGDAADSLDTMENGTVDVLAAGGFEGVDVAGLIGEYVSTGRSVLDLVAAGEPEAASALTRDELEPRYDALSSALLAERSRQFNAVFESDDFMARLGDVARFLVALIIPLAVILVFRELARRQQRQTELQLRLDTERAVGKTRDEFVASVSHELRTPLTSIYGISQLIAEDDSNPPATLELIDLVTDESNDLARMVEDLLASARIDAGAMAFHPEFLEVEDEVADIVRPFDKADRPVVVDVEPTIVRADRVRQRQLIRNLISNARKYGGEQVRVIGRADTNWYVWSIEDNGNGVPEELVGRLFERFVHQGTSVRVTSGGVGLGLSIVKALAEGMGGTAKYVREDGWTKFQVTVPIASESAVDSLAYGHSRRAEPAEPERV
ncbi:MAG: HAMP domain-containing histidine kinase [Acidimicrobiia bacterium]|nr:HAMP domain-containing histidine kinase [Acidimicrobiia bacterium]NNF65302.1 HAMP domain-containing histidine kinase [Acidimicrobiia bacterium]